MNRKKKEEPGLIYVIQKHLASRLHYDLRLEEDGVLKSWALPKEPPLQSADKRLAVEVEDHPLDYAKFQGTIPEGEYGAGQVEIWDSGYYQPLHRDQNIKEILLQGKKLKGVYTLVRIKDRRQDKKNLWLFFKNKNQAKTGLKNEKDSNQKRKQKT
ncbi:MAG: DNA polymerase ligase N-terminal domain-containing protein [Candidatus Saccharicenans sp.]|nr:DNA polymerase ligase N-terminal domain-containing protein [Candidatus Saccharicenans sp.]